MSSIRAVLFDFGGVLAEEGFSTGLMTLAKAQGLDSRLITTQGMDAVYDSGFVLGHGTEDDFWDLLCERSGLCGDHQKMTQQVLKGFMLRTRIMDLVRQLRDNGYITGILSDQTEWLDRLDAQYHFYECFDKIYNSYYLAKGKRDISLFSDVAKDIKLPPASILFIDDNQSNVERAQQMGLQAILFTDQESLIKEIQHQLHLTEKGNQ